MALRFLFLILCLGAATSIFTKKNPVNDAMEGVGNTQGKIQDGVDDTGNAVGIDKVEEGTGTAIQGTGDAIGGAAESVGATPDHVEVLGGADINPVSTALKCVINLTVQYMGIYTAIAILRVVAEFQGINPSTTWKSYQSLTHATRTVNYAPMLAIMFLACRMRVLWLTMGKGNPPIWLQGWMYAATFAVLAMTLVAIVVPLLTGAEKVEMNERGDIHEDAKPFEHKMAAICFTVLKYLIMICLYIGAICIIYGTYTYKPPAGSWQGEIPPVSPAVASTMILASMYFLVYAGIQFGMTFQSFTKVQTSKLTNALEGAVSTMFFAPMSAVLFIGARMRALQMDPINGNPQRWAQNCFYGITYAIMAQLILAIAVPLVMGGKIQKGNKGQGDIEYSVDNTCIGYCLIAARWIVMLSVYLGISAVIWSVFTIEHPKGPQYTPPISVTMQCVVNLTCQFFTIYTLIWVCITVKDVTGFDMAFIKTTMDNAIGTIAFCPMLAILFVGTRMRALQLTNNRGAPQGWVQDGMYMATWSILMQFLMVLLIPVCTYIMDGNATHPELDADGNVDPSKFNKGGKIGLIAVQVVRWLGFILLYVGTISVMVGAWTMTPETANGRGSVPIVGKTPFTKEPYGPNDIYGVPNF